MIKLTTDINIEGMPTGDFRYDLYRGLADASKRKIGQQLPRVLGIAKDRVLCEDQRFCYQFCTDRRFAEYIFGTEIMDDLSNYGSKLSNKQFLPKIGEDVLVYHSPHWEVQYLSVRSGCAQFEGTWYPFYDISWYPGGSPLCNTSIWTPLPINC